MYLIFVKNPINQCKMEKRNKTIKAFRQKLNHILMSKTMTTTYFQNIIESIESLPF